MREVRNEDISEKLELKSDNFLMSIAVPSAVINCQYWLNAARKRPEELCYLYGLIQVTGDRIMSRAIPEMKITFEQWFEIMDFVARKELHQTYLSLLKYKEEHFHKERQFIL